MNILLQLTYSGLFLAVLAQQVGLPIPSVVFLMAAGALSARGAMNPAIIVLLGVLGCLAGDGIWYWIGRKWGSKAMRLICRFTADPRGCSKDAQRKVPPIWSPGSVCGQVRSRTGCRHAATCRRGRSAARAFPRPRCRRQLALVSLLCRAGLRLLEPIGSRNSLGSALWNRPRYRDWGSDRPVCRLAGTDSGANDPANYGSAASVLRCSRAS